MKYQQPDVTLDHLEWRFRRKLEQVISTLGKAKADGELLREVRFIEGFRNLERYKYLQEAYGLEEYLQTHWSTPFAYGLAAKFCVINVNDAGGDEYDTDLTAPELAKLLYACRDQGLLTAGWVALSPAWPAVKNALGYYKQ